MKNLRPFFKTSRRSLRGRLLFALLDSLCFKFAAVFGAQSADCKRKSRETKQTQHNYCSATFALQSFCLLRDSKCVSTPRLQHRNSFASLPMIDVWHWQQCRSLVLSAGKSLLRNSSAHSKRAGISQSSLVLSALSFTFRWIVHPLTRNGLACFVLCVHKNDFRKISLQNCKLAQLENKAKEATSCLCVSCARQISVAPTFFPFFSSQIEKIIFQLLLDEWIFAWLSSLLDSQNLACLVCLFNVGCCCYSIQGQKCFFLLLHKTTFVGRKRRLRNKTRTHNSAHFACNALANSSVVRVAAKQFVGRRLTTKTITASLTSFLSFCFCCELLACRLVRLLYYCKLLPQVCKHITVSEPLSELCIGFGSSAAIQIRRKKVKTWHTFLHQHFAALFSRTLKAPQRVARCKKAGRKQAKPDSERRKRRCVIYFFVKFVSVICVRRFGFLACLVCLFVCWSALLIQLQFQFAPIESQASVATKLFLRAHLQLPCGSSVKLRNNKSRLVFKVSYVKKHLRKTVPFSSTQTAIRKAQLASNLHPSKFRVSSLIFLPSFFHRSNTRQTELFRHKWSQLCAHCWSGAKLIARQLKCDSYL